MRALRFSLLLAGLGLACGAPADDAEEEEDVESFSTTFPPVTTTTTGSDSNAASTGGASTDGSDTDGSGVDDGTSGATATDGDDGSTGVGTGDPLAVLDDEFDDPGALSNWTLKHEAEGVPAEHSMLNVGQTAEGFLTIRPMPGGWFHDTTGFFMYVELDGNFLVETYVNAGSLIGPTNPPTRPYNSAGLLLRDPEFGPGGENWVTHNLGFQLDSVATEAKSTVDSASNLDLQDGTNAGILRMCKVGSQIVLTRNLEGEGSFSQTYAFNRGDLTGTLQVGLAVGGWNSTGSAPNLMVTPDIEARFDYVRFRSIDSTDACLDP